MLTREEFAEHFNSLDPRLGGPNSPLWIPEEGDQLGNSEWFVCVAPLRLKEFKREYWDWCDKALAGRVRCYSSDSENKQEWWGFTKKEDIVLWTLKWT